jgi:enediyne biosynthesis protein E4
MRFGSPAPVLFCCFIASLSGARGALQWEEVSGGRKSAVTVADGRRTGFTLLKGEEIGIRFINRLDDRLVMQNNNFMEGSGLALGDFNGDGLCDIYFCAINGTNALYRNRGDWTFEDVTREAGVEGAGWHSTGASFADTDGDGDLDLLVNTLGQGTHCFENVGGERFRDVTDAVGLRSQTGSMTFALGDVDGDADLDLYVVNYGAMAILRGGGRADLKQVNGQWQVTGPYAERLRLVEGRLEEVGEPDMLYLNDSKGRFKAVPWNSEWFLDEQGKPMAAPWDFGLSAQIRDINADGHPDIYVCNDFQTVDRVWINDGTGHFRLIPKLAMRQQSFASMGADFADIDRDGRLDFFVVEMLSREHSRRQRQVAGVRPSYPMPGRFENRPEINRNTLFWNRGDGTYAEIANFSGVDASDWSWQPVFLDVDLDGFEDILIVDGNAYDVQDRDALQQVRQLGRQTPEQTRTNILLYPRLLTPNVAFRNRGDLTFEEVGALWGFNSREISQGIALADLDQDGDLDVVINCLYTGPLVYRNESTAPRVAVRLRGKPPNTQGIGAQVTLLGGATRAQTQEIVCGGRYLSGDDSVRVFAAGSLTNQMRLEAKWRSGLISVLDGVKGNNIYELDEAFAVRGSTIEQNTNLVPPIFTDVTHVLNHSHHEELFNDYARQPLLWKQLSQLGPGVAWFDFDGDGREELAIGSGKGGRLAVYRPDDRGGFARIDAGTGPLPDDATGLAGWVSSSGRRVLLGGVANYESSTAGAGVWGWEFGKQLTSTLLSEIPATESSTGPIAVADYDGDGYLDVFIGGRVVPGRYPQAATSRLFKQKEGRLIVDDLNQRLLEKIGLVSDAVWSDLSADGFPELILACEWGAIRVFRNDRGKLRPWDSGLESFTGWWNSVTTADLDGDGRLDILAGNWGLNSPFHATEAHPTHVQYGDIGGQGVIDLVEAYYAPELSAMVPRRALTALSQAAPALAQHFATHAAFSTATVSNIFQRLNIRPAEARATTLASMVFFNRGERFEALPMPTQAQWAPIFGMAVADFDGDGWQDIFLAQNFFALRPELPRLDAGRGLVLRGKPPGREGAVPPAPPLEAMPGQQSGIAIYGEQRGAAVCDFNDDGRMDLAVAQNGAATRLFQNVRGKPGLRVRLKGPPGNPHGIGAILRLHFETVSGPAHEIKAGGGYWSQDSAVPVLGTPEEPKEIFVLWPGGKTTRRPVKSRREIIVEWADATRPN